MKNQNLLSIQKSIQESAQTIQNLVKLTPQIEESINAITKCLLDGKKVVLFGNGGSAADAQHIAAELIGRYKLERKSYPAIALTTDTSCITALANDYSFDIVFSRQCEGLVNKNDVVIGISTSGNSVNVKKGLETAKKKGAITIGLLGSKGGSIGKLVDIAIIINSYSTPRIQEAHRTIYHIICEQVEKAMMDK
ncbi:MAG: D-sedoheptulose 7-phosphate isomerase [Nitrososphaerota archaeon]